MRHGEATLLRGLLKGWPEQVRRLRQEVLGELSRAPRPIYVYGASTKGQTLLQWWGTGRDVFEAAAERDPLKVGREMVGVRIPIVAELAARERAASFLVLPWHFREEIQERERGWVAGGGTLIFPLPQVAIVKA